MDQKDNLSTRHQRSGDATRPSDTLDRDRAPAHPGLEDEIDKAVENQSSVTPEDYPDR